MDATLDEDFVNFETFSQTCTSTILTSGTDEEIRILDNEASQRERKVKGEKESEKNNNNESPQDETTTRIEQEEMKPPNQMGGESTGLSSSSEYHLFTTFSYNSTSKKLTMIPVKYKIKEERRKVLKISVNKLKKIDDPESWLCRSVLINNTMKKLQKETREEKINKQMNGLSSYSKNYVGKSAESEEFGCQLSNNNNNNNNQNSNKNNSSSSSSSNNNNNNNTVKEKVYRVDGNDEADCFYQKELGGEGFYKLTNAKSEEFLFQVDKAIESEVKLGEASHPGDDSEEDKLNSSISGGVSLNEDFVEKIPSIKRCASRKKSVDEDGTADEILNLSDSELVLNCEDQKGGDLEEVDECDVHDVLSQLYMPPTPRMLASMEGGEDGEDELNVVDIDSSYIDNIKSECPKLPGEGFFENGLMGSPNGGGVKREREERGVEEEDTAKRRKLEDVFGCFNVCEGSYDNFLCSNRNGENERTSDECKEPEKAGEEEQLIELEDEEDIKRRLSQSLSSHYHRKTDKTCDNFFDESCDNQYSCGHTVTMFNDMQSVTFHNLIASLET